MRYSNNRTSVPSGGGTSRAKKISSRVLSTVLSVLIVASIFTALPFTVGAAETKKDKTGATSGSCGENLTWKYKSTTTTLTISGTGDMTNYTRQSSTNSNAPWDYYSSKITNVIIEDGVTSIGNYAFYCFKNPTNITIPDSVTSIGDSAFYYCAGLTSITLPDSVTSIGSNAFAACFNLASVTFDNNSNLLYIGDYAFTCCRELLNITLPNSLLSLGDHAFEECTGLTSVTFDNCTASIGSAFANCTELTNVVLGNNITSIGGSAFINCTGLTNITIPDSVTSLGDSSFAGCSNLETIIISNNSNLQSIGERAFSGCEKLLTKPNIPNSCTLNEYAFQGSQFDKGVINNTITWELNNGTLTISGNGNIPDYADFIHQSSSNRMPWYYSKDYITSLVIENGISVIGCFSFYYCTNLSEINISNSVQEIRQGAFIGCVNLSDITLPDNVYIQNGAFEQSSASGKCGDNLTWNLENFTLTISGTGEMYNYDGALSTVTNSKPAPWEDYLKGINKVVIQEGVTSIGSLAFYNCDNLKQITIPNTVTSIGGLAFNGCTDLTSITIPNSVTSIGEGAFSYTGLTNIPIFNENITTIPRGVFKGCTELTCINIPSNITEIGEGAFAYCNKATVVLPDTITSFGTWACFHVNRVAVPVDSTAYNLLTSQNFTRYRSSRTEVVGIVSSDQQFASVFSSASPKNAQSNGKDKGKISTGAAAKNSTGADPVEEQLTAEEIAENLSHVRCYLVDDVEIDESVTFDSNNDVVLHLNDFTVNSNGDLVDGTPHTLEGSTSGALIEVPGDLTIKTTGEGRGGITNDSGAVFDVKSGGSLTIENGNYSENVSEYIANNKVCGKTGNTYTVLNVKTEDLELENDGHQIVMPNNQDTFAREELVGVQMRAATDNVKEGMRFVSVVRSDILRGAEDYGYVLVKGRNIDNMNTNKENIYAGSNGCKTVSLKGSRNTLANTAYSSANLNEGSYKYLTAAVTDITDNSTAIGARFYVKRADGTYVYSDYICCATMGMIKAA